MQDIFHGGLIHDGRWVDFVRAAGERRPDVHAIKGGWVGGCVCCLRSSPRPLGRLQKPRLLELPSGLWLAFEPERRIEQRCHCAQPAWCSTCAGEVVRFLPHGLVLKGSGHLPTMVPGTHMGGGQGQAGAGGVGSGGGALPASVTNLAGTAAIPADVVIFCTGYAKKYK